MTTKMIAPSGVMTVNCRTGNNYVVDSTGHIAALANDIADLLNAGFLIEPAGVTAQQGSAATGGILPAGRVSQQVSAAGVGTGADTTEDVLFTYSLPASSLAAANKGVFIQAMGKVANNAHTKTIKMYFGSSLVYTILNATNANQTWSAWMIVLFSSSTASQVAFGESNVGSTLGQFNEAAGAEDSTKAITIKVTGQTATAAANDVTANMMTVDFNN